MFKPIKIMDIELSRPVTAIENLGDYDVLQALVRLHDTPIGYIKVPVVNGCCMATSLGKAILEEHSKAILHHLLYDRLASPLKQGRLRIEELLAVQHPVYCGSLPLVTVAVCTRDRNDDLVRCLESLKCLDYPKLDVIVVDNAPNNDATERLVQTKYPNVRYVNEPRPGLNWARNRAITEAKGDIIAYTDDDVVVDPGWIKAIAEIFSQNNGVMVVTGLVVPYEQETEAQIFFELRGGFGRGFKRKWHQMDKNENKSAASLFGLSGMFGTGANMAYRRSLFDSIGFFDPALDVGTVTHGGGDLEIFFRVLKEGFMLVYEPRAIVRHIHRRHYKQLRAQMASWGTGFYAYLVRSAFRYPDERFAIFRLGFWFLRFQIQRLFNSFLRPPAFPRKLFLSQLYGSFIGPFLYYKARRNVTKIVQNARPFSKTTIDHERKLKETHVSDKKSVAVRTVDLSQPLHALTDVLEYTDVCVSVVWNGCTLGSVNITNNCQPVSVTHLCAAIVEKLNFKLQLKETHVSDKKSVAVRTVDLSQPLHALTDVLEYTDVCVSVVWNGCTLGSVNITNNYQPVSVARLCDAVVENLNFRLLELDVDLSQDSLHDGILAALKQHYFPNKDVPKASTLSKLAG